MRFWLLGLLPLLLLAAGASALLQQDIDEAVNTTLTLISETDTLRKNELGFLQYFAVHVGFMFNSIEQLMRDLGVAESEVLRVDEVIDEAVLEIFTITKKQIANKDDLTLHAVRIMANLVNDLQLLPQDKDTLETLLEVTNNDLESAWRIIYALVDSVQRSILNLIEGLTGESAEDINNFLSLIQKGMMDQFATLQRNQVQTNNVTNSLIADLEEVIVNHLG